MIAVLPGDAEPALRRIAKLRSMWLPRRCRVRAGTLGAAFVLLGAGCAAAPLSRERVESDLQLRIIHAALKRTVDEAFASTDATWHAGWLGNALVHVAPGDHFGLCFHWQDRVFAGVRSTAEGIGWRITGVGAAMGQAREHHVVLVYDPTTFRPTEPLSAGPEDRAFILDAWRRGRPDIHKLSAWLEMYRGTGERPVLEPLPATHPDRWNARWIQGVRVDPIPICVAKSAQDAILPVSRPQGGAPGTTPGHPVPTRDDRAPPSGRGR